LQTGLQLKQPDLQLENTSVSTLLVTGKNKLIATLVAIKKFYFKLHLKLENKPQLKPDLQPKRHAHDKFL
jgi:hypothetical protein